MITEASFPFGNLLHRSHILFHIHVFNQAVPESGSQDGRDHKLHSFTVGLNRLLLALQFPLKSLAAAIDSASWRLELVVNLVGTL